MLPNDYTAEKLMQVKSETELMCFLTTIWMGKSIMLIWDRINGGIMTIWGNEELDDTDIERLSEIVWTFIDNEKPFSL